MSGVEMEFEWDSREIPFSRGSGAVETALSRAIRLAGNKVLREVQDESTTYVTTHKVIASEPVREGLDLVFPSAKEAIASLAWTERVSGQAMPLAKFQWMPTALGVMVRVNLAGGFKLIPSAFSARMSSGHLGIFGRNKLSPRYNGRLPIYEMWGTKISDSMSDAGAADGVLAKAMEKFGPEYEKGLKRELAKLKRKGDA